MINTVRECFPLDFCCMLAVQGAWKVSSPQVTDLRRSTEAKRQYLDQRPQGPAEPSERGPRPESESKTELPPSSDQHKPKAIVMDCPDVPGSGGHLPTLRTSDFYNTCNLPKRFDYPSWFYGYGIQKSPQEHPFYRTTSSDYGRYPPTIHSVPTAFFPNNQEFSKALAKTGMYRNYSLNTGLDPHI